MTGSWDPTQYERYSGHRSRPARELLNRVDHDHPRHVVDLGCGTGDMARAMKQRWPQARGVAVDRSVKMLSTAVEAGGEVEWREADIAQLTPDNPVDVLYSNAALQWLPDHQMRFPGLISFLARAESWPCRCR